MKLPVICYVVNFATPTHSLSFKCIYKQITGYEVFSHLYRVHSVCMQVCTDRSSLSVYDTPGADLGGGLGGGGLQPPVLSPKPGK